MTEMVDRGPEEKVTYRFDSGNTLFGHHWPNRARTVSIWGLSLA